MLLLLEKPKVRDDVLPDTIFIGRAKNTFDTLSGRWRSLFVTLGWPPIDQVFQAEYYLIYINGFKTIVLSYIKAHLTNPPIVYPCKSFVTLPQFSYAVLGDFSLFSVRESAQCTCQSTCSLPVFSFLT